MHKKERIVNGSLFFNMPVITLNISQSVEETVNSQKSH
jgi:hypothetical protein